MLEGTIAGKCLVFILHTFSYQDKSIINALSGFLGENIPQGSYVLHFE